MWWLLTVARAQDPAPAPEPVPAPAPAPAPNPRDADIFGAPAPEPAPEPEAPRPEPEPPPTGRDASVLGSSPSSAEAELGKTLQELDDRLTIGGRLWLEVNGAAPEGASGPEDVVLDSPNYLDLFADARPNDRVRAYAQARLQHDWTVLPGATNPLTGDPIPQDSILLDQLWAKFDIAHRVFVTAGRQRIRWGAGRFWNPTDFLNQQRLDPLAILDLRTGVDLLKVHVPFEAAGANVYAVANLADSASLDQVGGAARAEWAFGSSEISATAAARKDQPLELGADLSSGLGPFDIHAEGAVQHGANGPFYEGRFDAATFAVPDEVDRSDEWLAQIVAGAEVQIKYSNEDSIAIGAEYFYNALGYPDAHLYPYLFLNDAFRPLYTGQQYVAGYVALFALGPNDDQNFTASALANLFDRSALARLTWTGTALTWLQPTAFVQYHFGDTGELHYGVDIDPIPVFLPDGVKIVPPLVDVGLGAIVRF